VAREKVNSPSQSAPPRLGCRGLLVRKERWVLSWKGRLLLLALVLGALFLAVEAVYPFLAPNHPVQGEFLVVEGWIPSDCLKQAAVLGQTGHYPKIFTTGCKVTDLWGLPPLYTFADMAAERLNSLGVSNGLVQAVPSHLDLKDRTYNSAMALKEWCATHHQALKSFDVLTLGPHARRTWLLYEKAFGDDVKIGIIAVEDQTYEPARWWASSEGVREVVGEGIAYVYARVLFHQSNSVPGP
jgi:hypothetical protein